MSEKVWSKLKKFIGVTEEQDAAKKWRPVARKPSSPAPRKWWGRRGWRRFSLPRRALGPGRRKARLAFIRQSQLQGIEIAAKRREAMKRDREAGGHLFMQAFRRSQRGV